MASRPRYSDHVDLLLALVTYLALTWERARSPHGTARDLGLEEADVEQTLRSFPGLFRRSRTPSGITPVGNQHMYTLHARYARRRCGPGSDPQGAGEELDADQLRALLDFITEQARLEKESHRHALSQVWVLVGIFIAAAASLVSAVVQTTGKA